MPVSSGRSQQSDPRLASPAFHHDQTQRELVEAEAHCATTHDERVKNYVIVAPLADDHGDYAQVSELV